MLIIITEIIIIILIRYKIKGNAVIVLYSNDRLCTSFTRTFIQGNNGLQAVNVIGRAVLEYCCFTWSSNGTQLSKIDNNAVK